MEDQEQIKFLHVVMELEKKYPLFKKMDVYTTASDAYKKIHHLFRKITDRELEEIKNLAEQDLRLS